MAELPRFRRRAPLPGIDKTNALPSVRLGDTAGGAIGAGLEGISDSGLFQALDNIQKSKEAAWIARTAGEAEIWSAEEERRLESESDEGAVGHVNAYRQSFDTYRKGALKAAPSRRAKDELALQLQNIEVAGVKRRGVFQARADLAKRGEDFEKAAQANVFAVRQNPGGLGDVLARQEALMESAIPWMPADALTKTRANANSALVASAAEGFIEQEDFVMARLVVEGDEFGAALDADTRAKLVSKIEDAEKGVFVRDEGRAIGEEAATGGGGGMESYKAAIAGIESRGHENPYAAVGPKVKGDRAYGKYQVMGKNIGPWTKKYVGRSMTADEFVASPEAQEAVFEGEFGRLVKKYGNPQDAASVWFSGRPLGQGGNPSDGFTKRDDYVAAFTEGLSASDAGGLTADEIIAERVQGIEDPDLRDRVIREARSVYGIQTADQARIDAEQKMDRAKRLAVLEVGVSRNEASYADIDLAYSNGEITPAQWADLTKAKDSALAKAEKEGADLRSAQARVAAGDKFDIFDSGDRKAVDLVYENSDQTPETALVIAHRTGVVPQQAINDLRQRMTAGDPTAFELAENLDRAAPQGLRREGGEEIDKQVDTYRALTRVRYTSMEAARRASLSDETMRENAATLDVTRKEFNKITVDDILGSLSVSGLTGWGVDLNPARQGRLKEDYRIAYEQARIDGNNHSDAKAIATQRLDRFWGYTTVNDGDDDVMRYPPEKFYPPDASGSFDYVREQAIAKIMASDGREVTGLKFTSDIQTEADVRAGIPPRYKVFYTDADGVFQEALGYFRPDPRTPLVERTGERKEAFGERKRAFDRVEEGRKRDEESFARIRGMINPEPQ